MSNEQGICEEIAQTVYDAADLELPDTAVKALERWHIRRGAKEDARKAAPGLLAANRNRDVWIVLKAMGLIEEGFREAGKRLSISHVALFKRVAQIKKDIRLTNGLKVE